MPTRRPSKNELLRGVEDLPAYPAVLVPAPEGGFEVVFPNIAKLTAYGANRERAVLAAEQMLSAHLQMLLEEGQAPPRPSSPKRLIADEEEPPGTELTSIRPDKKTILKRLGLEKRADKGLALSSLGRLGR